MDLEIRQDQRFQQREWRLERIGWTLIALFVLAGLLGLLGPGPLSWATARSDGGLVEVEYQRFTHWVADDTVEIRVAPDAVGAGAFEVTLTGDWVEGRTCRASRRSRASSGRRRRGWSSRSRSRTRRTPTSSSRSAPSPRGACTPL